MEVKSTVYSHLRIFNFKICSSKFIAIFSHNFFALSGGPQHIRQALQQRLQTSPWTAETLHPSNGPRPLLSQQDQAVADHTGAQVLVVKYRTQGLDPSHRHDRK